MYGRKTAAVLAAAAPLALIGAGVATAAPGSQTYTANLSPVPLNGQTSGSGTFTMTLDNGNTARIHEHVSGLAATFMGGPFPHVQHIHGGAQGTCPSASADKNGDGVINTSEAQPDYGPIHTTLSVKGSTAASAGTNVKIAPSGASFTYNRTINLDSTTMNDLRNHDAVIVVHGLDPKTAAKAAATKKSELPGTHSLPLAATAPAICGALQAAPVGAAQTGGGGTAGTEHESLFALGGLLVVAAGGSLLLRRRQTSS